MGDGVVGGVEQTEAYLERHPALLVVIFVLLSAWWVSELREPILRWLGVAGF